MFHVRIPDDRRSIQTVAVPGDLFVAAECDQMPVSCDLYMCTLIKFGVFFRRNDLNRIFPIQPQVVENTVGENPSKITHFSSLTYTASGIDFDSATWRCLFDFHCKSMICNIHLGLVVTDHRNRCHV